MEHAPDAMRIYVEKWHKGEFCPACNRFTDDHHSRRPEDRAIQDIPYGKPTCLIVRTERFDCPCGTGGITETYASIPKGAQKTKRSGDYLQEHNHASTFMHNARENGVPVSSVCGRFMGFVQKAFRPLARRAAAIRFPTILNLGSTKT